MIDAEALKTSLTPLLSVHCPPAGGATAAAALRCKQPHLAPPGPFCHPALQVPPPAHPAGARGLTPHQHGTSSDPGQP
jgi:hypothetical protein